jgi:hypothetical protein
MPIILTQHYSPADRPYEDAEFSLYHYPRVYFSRVEPYDRFIYYRPLGRSARRADSQTYFGYGNVGVPYPDPRRADHRFVDLIKAAPFPALVPMRDFSGDFYETESGATPQFQSAVRRISETAYYKILAAARVSSTALDALPSTERVSAFILPGGHVTPPRDTFRIITEIPPGAGYVPRGAELNVNESAALQERARADHQAVLQLVANAVHARGGTLSYNNNVDLYADFGSKGLLVEAKSLGDLRDAVDRMRYGLGQLADYGFRYKAELHGATPMLAFGRAPDRETGWIADVLQENDVAFVARVGDALEPLNDAARATPLFGSG